MRQGRIFARFTQSCVLTDFQVSENMNIDPPSSTGRLCNVCGSKLNEPIYASAKTQSITSLCQVWPVATTVFFCSCCGHVQTSEEADLANYYANDYKILINSEEEDQIYEVRNGKNIYRTDHQVETFFSLITPPANAQILDFGCAKSGTLRRIIERRPDIVPHLFDVSDMYLPFWERFVKPENWAIRTIEDSWNGHFDLVTSFFSLEHAADAQGTVKQIASLLKPGGLLYAIVPNIFTNIADLIVVDHINHFTETSLEFVMQAAGLSVLKNESDLHTGAFIVLAQKNGEKGSNNRQEQIASNRVAVEDIANFWKVASNNVRTFELELDSGKRAAIYGSGFYGTFIGTCIQNLSTIDCIVDQNPFLQGRFLFEKPVVSPENLPPQVEVIYVGLNPATARNAIEAVTCWADRKLTFFYL